MRNLGKLIFILFVAVSCTTNSESDLYSSKAIITGFDGRRCASPCCGGWYISIDSIAYRFFEVPEESKTELSLSIDVLPIEVELDWNAPSEEESCLADIIDVIRIREAQ